MMRSSFNALSLLLVGMSGCLPGPEQLQDSANLEVLVTGLRAAEVVSVDVDAAESFAQTARADVVRFFLTVPVGPREGVVSLERDALRRCVTFRTDVDAAERRIVGVDVGRAIDCDAPAPRGLVSLEEVVIGECGDSSCTTVTTFAGTGTIVVAAPGNNGEGRGAKPDSEALVQEALSADADALFATDGCGPLGGPARESVELTRTVDDNGDLAAAVVDVSNCRSGIAARLRARLSLLRDHISEQ